MPLEAGTYINDLVEANPAGGDALAHGDDHLRLIKKVLRRSFPGLSRALLDANGKVLEGSFADGTISAARLDVDTDAKKEAFRTAIGAGSGGAGNPSFFRLGADKSTSGAAFINAVSGVYTLDDANATVAILFNASLGPYARLKFKRDNVELVEDLNPASQWWERSLVLDKPGSVGPHTYASEFSRHPQGIGSTILRKGSNMLLFQLPEDAKSNILAADTAIASNTDFLSVSITPRTAESKIRLNLGLISEAVHNSSLTIMRENVELISGIISALSSNTSMSNGFNSWVDEPNTTNEVTYHLRINSDRTLSKGSYLLAQEL